MTLLLNQKKDFIKQCVFRQMKQTFTANNTIKNKQFLSKKTVSQLRFSVKYNINH